MSGICIDIEIDEKYSSNGNLIHYEYSSHDEARNQFFLDHRWLVIRFAEKQILDDIEGCAATVLRTVIKYDPAFVFENLHFFLLFLTSEPTKLKRWRKSISETNEKNPFYIDLDELPF